jgi:hypothetical protein
MSVNTSTIPSTVPSKPSNGEIAAWIDGELYLHLTGFNWRTTDELKIKRISLGIYIHNNPQENICWFDDIVLSTGYIGP